MFAGEVLVLRLLNGGGLGRSKIDCGGCVAKAAEFREEMVNIFVIGCGLSKNEFKLLPPVLPAPLLKQFDDGCTEESFDESVLCRIG